MAKVSEIVRIRPLNQPQSKIVPSPTTEELTDKVLAAIDEEPGRNSYQVAKALGFQTKEELHRVQIRLSQLSQRKYKPLKRMRHNNLWCYYPFYYKLSTDTSETKNWETIPQPRPGKKPVVYERVAEIVRNQPGLTRNQINALARYTASGTAYKTWVADGKLLAKNTEGTVSHWRFYPTSLGEDTINVVEEEKSAIQKPGYQLLWNKAQDILLQHPGLTHAELEQHLGHSVSVATLYHWVNKGIITYDGRSVRKPNTRYYAGEAVVGRHSPALEAIIKLLRAEPGLTVPQVSERIDVNKLGHRMSRWGIEGRLKRVNDGGIYRYYAPDEAEEPKQTPVEPKAPSVNVRQFAMEYLWDTQLTGYEAEQVKKFVTWLEERDNG